MNIFRIKLDVFIPYLKTDSKQIRGLNLETKKLLEESIRANPNDLRFVQYFFNSKASVTKEKINMKVT